MAVVYTSSGDYLTTKNVEIELIRPPYRNIITGIYEYPVFSYSPKFWNPYYGEVDLLNEDYEYQDRTINFFYVCLTEKWLHKKNEFKKLLDYFKVSKNGDEYTVSLVSDPSKNVDRKLSDADIRHIFHYIEKKFATKHFVEITLREYVVKHRTKWYDLYVNKHNIRDLFSRKLKKKISDSIDAIKYEK